MPSRTFAASSGISGQYLIGGTPFNNNMTTYTLTAWVYPTAVPDFPTARYFPVIWKGLTTGGPRDLQGPSMSIYSDASGHLQLWCQQTYATQDASVFTLLSGQLPLNTWSLISFVVNANGLGSAQGYVNGVEVVYDPALSKPAIGAPDDDSTHPWTISVDIPGDPNSSSFQGQISDVRIYTRVLSAAELLQLASFVNPSSTGLSAEWPLCGVNPERDIIGGNDMTEHLAAGSVNQPHQFCPAATHYSVPDSRTNPNHFRYVQDTYVYDSQVSANPAIPSPNSNGFPTDSRTAATVPINSRAPGTFGPGE